MTAPVDGGAPPQAPLRPVLDPASLDPTETAPPTVERAGATGLTPDGRLKSGRLAGLSMRRAILTIAWPVLVDSMLNSLVGLTDTVLAAGISEAATDAIGGASYILWFIGLTLIALDVGATALVSRAVGGGRLAVASAVLGQTMLLAGIVGVGMGAVVALGTDGIASVMSMNDEARAAFRGYMHIIAAGVPFLAILVGGIACLRGAGDSFRAMNAMVLVNIVNIVAAWTLSGVDLARTRTVDGVAQRVVILHNPFGFDMGVEGIALGTVLGEAAGAGLILWIVIRGFSGMRLRRKRLAPHWHTVRRLLRIGLPNYFETLGMWVGNFFIITMVGWMGPGLLGAHIVAIRIEALSFQAGFAIGTAAAALAGQYLGARSAAMAHRAILMCSAIAAGAMGVMGAAFMIWPRQIVGLFTTQPTHLDVTPTALMITGAVQVPFAVAIVLRSAMRGAGDVRVVMYLTWLSTYAVRLPLAYALCGVDIPLPDWLGGGVLVNPFPWDGGLAGLWVALCIEIVIRAALFAARFIQGGWSRVRV